MFYKTKPNQATKKEKKLDHKSRKYFKKTEDACKDFKLSWTLTNVIS